MLAMRATNTSPELEAYLDHTRTPLDLLALLTLWVVLVPFADFDREGLLVAAVIIRVAVSAVYAFDIARRARLAPRHWRYVTDHPLALLAVLFPPVRVVFSLRLISSLFKKGALGRFLIAAILLLLNGAVLIYFVERGAPDSNIHTVGESLWWAIVTVTTVGYGDLYPVTVYGRVVASAVMIIGLITLAVITANVSAAFNEQARRRRVSEPGATVGADVLDLDELRRLRDRLDAVLAAAEPAPSDGDRRSSGSDDDDLV
jgi:voltage-gated potassium channel